MKEVVELTQKEQIVLIVETKLKWLKTQQKDGKDHSDDFGKEVASYIKQGIVTENALIESQNHGLRGKDVGDVSTHVLTNKSGLTHAESIGLGHKIQFIYISYHMLKGRTDGKNLFRESMKSHEDGIDAIFHDTYDPIKLEVLKELPEIEEWDHNLGAAAYHKIF